MNIRLLVLVVMHSTAWTSAMAEDSVDFQRDIRPLLSDRCYRCHGPDEHARQADLRLDQLHDAQYVIGADDPATSELLRRITCDDESELMPPPESKLQLKPEEIDLIRRWIAEGAVWQEHWAFQNPSSPPLPPVSDPTWPANEIDYFILEQLDRRGLTPADRPSKEKLIRRVSFDLTGLPPTLREIDNYLADSSPRAFHNVVERLLDSPQFGERMASEWLDVARYSDTYGYQVDRDRYVWPWRDWVIQAFNRNLPYDQFVLQQVAGDLLPAASDDQILATTFNRLHSQKVEGGSVPEEFRVEYVADRTHTFATAFLGLTLECARCHDHKFDPLSQAEYYQLFSFFNNIDEAGLYSYFTNSVPTPTLVLADDGQKLQQKQLRQNVEQAADALRQLAAEEGQAFSNWLDDLAARRALVESDEPLVPGLIKHIDFREIELHGNSLAGGDDLESITVKLSGDDEIKLDVGNFRRFDPFTISCRIRVPDHKDRAVVYHRSRAWTDAASRGYQLLIENGKLSASLIHFWPGNAVSVQSVDALPLDRWLHVAWVYDGSSRAAGLRLFVDGRPQPVEVIRDQLTKNITGGGQDHLAIGARFRDRGFTNGLIGDFRVFDRGLTEIEIRQLYEPRTLPDLFSKSNDRLSDQERRWLGEYFRWHHDSTNQAAADKLRNARKLLCEFEDKLTEIMVMRELAQPRPAYRLSRGAYDDPAEAVSANTPAVLPPLPVDWPRNRLGLAQWVTHRDHPLLARVTVNRYWQMIFARGLVRTPEDFGSQGAPPTHPQLLDWLARDFVDHGWDVKRLLRQLVTSATYRQSTKTTVAHRQADPDNVWLGRSPSYRLPAEMIRDQALATSGLMIDVIGGAPVRPYEVAAAFKPSKADQGPGLYRRSLYTYWKRTSPAPVMTTLDAATRDVCRVRRERTSTPIQGLVLLNDPQMIEAARHLAQRTIVRHSHESSLQIGIELFRLATSRHPSDAELDIVLKLYRQQVEHFAASPEEAAKYLSVGHNTYDPAMEANQLAAWSTVAGTLMAMDECVNKR